MAGSTLRSPSSRRSRADAARAVAAVVLVLLAPAFLRGAAASAAVPVADPVTVLLRAHRAYESGEFAAAAEGYRALLAAGHQHPLLHYNLGNAQLRRGELGRAIASYLRASAGAPRDREVSANLAFARRSARDALTPPEPSALARAVFAWHYALAPRELWLAAAVLNALLWSLLALRLWWRREALSWVAGAVALLLLVCGGSLAARELLPRRVAVVLPRQVEARAGDSELATVRFRLHAGSEVLVREVREGWLRVALPDGEQGWLEAGAVEMVER